MEKNTEVKKVIRNQGEKKQAIRKQILEKRAAMSPTLRQNAEAEIARLLFSCPYFLSAKKIFCYKSFGSEAGTDKIIREALRQGKLTAVPKTEGRRRMEFYFIDSLSELVPGRYGIPEPKGMPDRRAVPDEESLILLPCVAFDLRGTRLGYGGGYYDTYLNVHREGKKAAVAFEMQRIRSVPKEDHDICADIVITEAGKYDVTNMERKDDMALRLPKDPVILLGVVNTKLRDFYSSLDMMCDDLEIEKTELTDKLAGIGYEYDEKRNQFL